VGGSRWWWRCWWDNLGMELVVSLRCGGVLGCSFGAWVSFDDYMLNTLILVIFFINWFLLGSCRSFGLVVYKANCMRIIHILNYVNTFIILSVKCRGRSWEKRCRLQNVYELEHGTTVSSSSPGSDSGSASEWLSKKLTNVVNGCVSVYIFCIYIYIYKSCICYTRLYPRL